MSKPDITVILGSSDAEGAAIERVCLAAGLRVAYAVGSDGNRVHPGNAYRAVGYTIGGQFCDAAPSGTVWLVECDIVRDGFGDGVTIVRIDHHRPGDPGYGRPPEQFMSASSIGQVVSELGRLSRLPKEWKHTTETPVGWYGRRGCGHDHNGLWVAGPVVEWVYRPPNVPTMLGGTVPAQVSRTGYTVPADIALVAAADHCLEAAYRGRCPGVDPEALMRWRAESRAAFQGRTVEAVLADVEAARKVLTTHLHQCRRFCESERGHRDDWSCEIADLRGLSIPELPEAAAREGIAFLATVRDRDGREKVVLQAATPELVSRFLAGEIVPGLKDIYGDPARGFAGGYKE